MSLQKVKDQWVQRETKLTKQANKPTATEAIECAIVQPAVTAASLHSLRGL